MDNSMPLNAQRPVRRRVHVSRLVGVAALAAAVLILVRQPWHGPILLTLSAGHGVDLGDLVVLPLVAIAFVCWRPDLVRLRGDVDIGRPRRGVAGPVAAIVLGGLLLTVGTLILTDSTALLPAGGGTFAGALANVGGRTRSPVDQWTYVAVTYDSTALRLYVNGREVSRTRVTGEIQRSGDPLWIGGNAPFGEHFSGRIDELRVYDRALGPSEIVVDMRNPVESPPNESRPDDERSRDAGLVAAYGFDAGAGDEVADSSGHGNVGVINGAEWTSSGRFGGALSFDGDDDVVQVSASSSLDLGSAMTLSAWFRPDALQEGWRTIVYRQTDAYFLDASSELWGREWRFDDAVAALVVVAAAWLAFELMLGGTRLMADRRRSGLGLIAALVGGCALDVAFAPSGTVFLPLFLAVWFATTARRRVEAIVGWVVATGLGVLTVVVLAGVDEVALRFGRDGGGEARSAALGACLVAAGWVRLLPRRS
jgi:hypothetical protein